MPFPFDEYVALAAAMRTCKGKMMVSINDHPEIRQTFSGLPTLELEITYSTGSNRDGRNASRELVITNWEPSELGGLFKL